jgi:hypothetical protein
MGDITDNVAVACWEFEEANTANLIDAAALHEPRSKKARNRTLIQYQSQFTLIDQYAGIL